MDVLLHIEMLVRFALEMKGCMQGVPSKGKNRDADGDPLREEGVSLGEYY